MILRSWERILGAHPGSAGILACSYTILLRLPGRQDACAPRMRSQDALPGCGIVIAYTRPAFASHPQRSPPITWPYLLW